MKKKKSHPLMYISLIIIILPSILVASMDNYEGKGDLSVNAEYILDQKQVNHSHESNIHSRIWIAQSFKPSMTPLTKIDIKIDKRIVIESYLSISIRKNLTGTDLTYSAIPSNQIPYYTNWIEFDFPDIEVEIDETYYIIIHTNSPSGKSYHWLDEYNLDCDFYERGKQWQSNDYGATWTCSGSEGAYTDSTFRTYSYISVSDLDCTGFFNWSDVKPGEIVNGSFTVENSGTPLSYINWKILQWPSWGVWSFTPSNGSRLMPEDGLVSVQVSVEAPHSSIPDEYLGEIRIINEDNDDDYCIISASLVTPKNKDSIDAQPFQLLKRIICRPLFLEKIIYILSTYLENCN